MDEDWPRVDSAVSMMSDAPIFIDDSGALTPTEVRARARRLKREHGLGLIVVDYLQLMQVSGTVENRATEISEISRSLKALAKELDVPVIALSQLNRSVEQRQDKRPVMSDLRECVTGDTLVCLTDGRRVPIRDLVDTEPEVWSVDGNQRLTASRADKVWKVGRRTVVRVDLASGRSIRTTRDHRLLAGKGWVTTGELAIGDRLALARRIPEPAEPEAWPDHALILLGHLVGDGSYLKHQPLRYTTASEANSAAVREAAEAFGSTVKRYAGRRAWHQLLISGNGNRWKATGVGRWLKELGIFGQRSHEKRLPAGVFALPRERIAVLLKHLWATDGSITLRRNGGGAPRAYFSTCSQGLAFDVAALLLRIEIVARIRVFHPTRGRPLYSVDVSGASAQRKFLDAVGGFGPRAGAAANLAEYLANVESNTNVDTLPMEVFTAVRARMRASGVSTRAMAAQRGTAYGGTSHFRFAPSRDLAADYARLLDAPEIARWAESDLFWDRVVSVTEEAEEEVFDLTVPGPANWLADGIVTHNSGAIEQDADVILFIYREEVYERDTPRKGIADIIVAKQRNGPVGEFRLTFLGEFTRFENLVAEAYGEASLSSLAQEEAHLHAGELNDVVVLQLARLSADRHAVHEREAFGLAALDVHDVVALGAPRDGGNLHARTAERRQRFDELELAAGERARQHLQLRERQCRSGALVDFLRRRRRERRRGSAAAGGGVGAARAGADAAAALAAASATRAACATCFSIWPLGWMTIVFSNSSSGACCA